MSTGTIKTIVDGKNFGFIAPDGQKPGDKELFFHEESLVDVKLPELRAGDRVSFDVEAAEKGPRAVNVKRA